MSSKDKNRKLIEFALLTALFTWGLLCYGKLGQFMYEGILFARNIDGRPYVSDFANHYNAGVLARRCLEQKQEIYNIDVQNNSLKELIAPVVPEQPFYLQYPPYFFLLAMPLAFMNMNIAWLVWNLLGIGFGAFGLWKLAGLLGYERQSKLLLLGLAFSSYPAWLSAEIGQTSIYLLAAASFMLYFLLSKKPIAAGCTSALLMVKLQYAPVFFLIGLIFGRAKFLLSWGLSLAVLLVLSVLMLGVDNVIQYPHYLLSGETGTAVSGVSSFMMQNFRGELVLLFRGDNSAVKIISLVIFALGTAFSSYLLIRSGSAPASSGDDPVRSRLEASAPRLALAIMIALMVSPHTHVQDYLLLAVAAAFLFAPGLPGSAGFQPASTSITQRAIDSKARSMLYWFPLLSWFFFYTQPFLALVYFQPFFFYLLTILLLSMPSLFNRQAV